MSTDVQALLELAAAVADGRAPAWHEASADASLDAIGDLRVISEIARLHRERLGHLSGDDAEFAAATAAEDQPAGQRRWAHLRLVERLGTGAFGEVFRAWDTSLDREVALKLLRPGASRQPRSESALHEGQRLAKVSHPNVMAVFGAQVADGRLGIWGELIDGRTLADIVERDGPLSAKEACAYGEALCRALATAHRQGILHRDVKAQNVMRERGGRIVLMDFGLGLDVAVAGEANRLAGTPVYLAPELIDGGQPSPQSDIYSLGVLLFYLVTGTMPVTGRALKEIADKHRRGDRLRLQDLRGDLPEPFVRVVDRALQPTSADRFSSAGEMQAALALAAESVVPDRSEPHGPARVVALVAAAAVVSAGLTAGAVLWSRDVPAVRPLVASIAAPSGVRFTESQRNVAAISPDGQYVAFVATQDGQSRLWVRSLATGDARALPDTAGAGNPFWSTDSATVGFFSGTGLRTISLGGVRSEILATTTEDRGGTWNREGTILFAGSPRGGLSTVRATGGASDLVLRPDSSRAEIGFLWPQFLADGRRFVFFVWSNDERVRGIYVGRLGSSDRTRLVGSDTSAVVAGDHLLFVRNGTLVAQRLDVDQARVLGAAHPIAQGVSASPAFRSVVTASETGTLIYTPFRAADLTQFRWFDDAGRSLETLDAIGKFRNPDVSNDGHFLAAQLYRDSISELQLFDLERGDQWRLPHAANAEFPVWSPDGRLAFAATDSGWLDLFVTSIDVSSTAELLYASEADKMPSDWSRDGRYLSFTSLSAGGSYDLYVLSVDPRGSPIVVADSDAEEADGHFSPDGRQLAFVSTASGRPEVYVAPFPAGTTTRKVSADGGLSPTWSQDGALYFIDLTGRVMRVRVPLDPGARIPVPQAVFDAGVINATSSRNHFALGPGTRRFLVNQPATMDRSTSLTVVGHWMGLLPQAQDPSRTERRP